MTNIKFVSHEFFPDDPYTKEMVYLCLDDKFRVAYVRKAGKNGGLFWGVVRQSVSKDGGKSYYEAFLQDSIFSDKDVRDFLEKRSWETKLPDPRPVITIASEEIPF